MSNNITDEKYLEWLAALDHLVEITQAMYLHSCGQMAIENGLEEAEAVILSDELVEKLLHRTVELTQVDRDVTAMLEERGLLETFKKIEREQFSMPELEEARAKQIKFTEKVLSEVVVEED